MWEMIILLALLGLVALVVYKYKHNSLDSRISREIDKLYSKPSSSTLPLTKALSKASSYVGSAVNALDEWQKEQQKKVYQNIGVMLGVSLSITIARKVAVRVGERMSKKYAKIIAKSATNVLTRVASKLGVDLISKLGLKSATMVSRIATKAAAAAARVSAAGGATIAFEVLSLTMDILDVGGYGNMNTLEYYTVLKKTAIDQLNSALSDAGEDIPVIVGPLDSLIDLTAAQPNAAYMKALNDKIADMMTNPKDLAIAPLMTAIQKAGLSSEADIGTFIDNNFDKYVTDAALDDLTNRALASVCTDKKGVMVNGQCSFSQSACNNQYTWPRTDSDTDTYTEWDSTVGGCVQASPAIRTACESAGMTYDQDARQCKVTEDYCRGKGAQWAWNDNIKAYDCSIPKGQEIAELILGTTVTRGLIQVFDPKQYEPCPSGWTDLGYSCSNQTCPDGYVLQDGMCYKPCKAGYSGAATMCVPDCPPGYRNDGLYCYKAGSRGTTYGRGVGRIPDANCDPGWTLRGGGALSWCDNGAFWPWDLKTQNSNKSCGDNEEMYGGLCYPKCDAGYHADGCCLCSQDCPPGMIDIGISCQKQTYDRGVGLVPALAFKFKGRAIPYGKGDPAANAKALGDSVSQAWKSLGKK